MSNDTVVTLCPLQLSPTINSPHTFSISLYFGLPLSANPNALYKFSHHSGLVIPVLAVIRTYSITEQHPSLNVHHFTAAEPLEGMLRA